MDRYDRLQPAALIASIASLPRRWKEATRVPVDHNLDDYFALETDHGSIAEHFGAAITQINVLRGAIRTTSYNVPDPVDSSVVAAAANAGTGPWPKSAKDGLAQLTHELEELKSELDGINIRDWNKAASTDSGSITLLALAQGTSRVAAERLAVVERLVRDFVN